MTKIAFIPIDNRPVCYTLAQQIALIDKGLELLLPPREMLGNLKKTADINGIINWLSQLEQVEKIIVSLDTIAYGGLIPSRRSTESIEEIISRMENFKSVLVSKNAQVYAFSSIMRISNNNVNEEEKEYWNLYGKKIFEYSYNLHKNNCHSEPAVTLNLIQDPRRSRSITDSLEEIPEEIIQDYLNTRNRNFTANKMYLDWAKDGILNTLVFSKDDCAQYGLNVAEAQALEKMIEENNINALVKTGADEIPLSLLSRALTAEKELKIAPVFTQKDYTDKISKYEDVSVYESVKGQIELAGCKIADTSDCDIVLLVNNFKEEQGELVMGIDVEGFDVNSNLPKILQQKPYLVADILNANGSDNNFVEKLFENSFDWQKFLGYAGWNTTGNTLGSVLCCAIVKFLAQTPDTEAFKKVQAVRFLDDWAYQANVRKSLKSKYQNITEDGLSQEIKPYESILSQKLQTNFGTVKYSYPWDRFFEIEVSILH